jgi:hypothetical protein
VSGVPQRGQNVRVACAVERIEAGSPATKLNVVRGTLNQETKAAPLSLRQIEQWQLVALYGDASVA